MKLTESKLREIIQEELTSLNEGNVNLKRDLKYLKKHYTASIDDDMIQVEGENPFDDDHDYTFYWDGEYVQAGTSMSSQEWSEPIENVDDFVTLIDDGSLKGGEWE